MKAFAIRNAPGISNLQPFETETPKPGARQILVRVHSVSLNYRDLMTVKNPPAAPRPAPLIPLSDGAGEVVEIGSEVVKFKVGDRVAGNFFQGWAGGVCPKTVHKTSLGGPLPGMLSEYVVLEETCSVVFPDHLSYDEASTLPCAALTAWNSMFEQGNLKSGQTVLIQGTGGVSVFALQFAKAAGAKVVITSSNDEKLERAKSMGADVAINYVRTPDWDREVFEATGKLGVDQIVEVGGAATLQKSLSCIGYEGFIGVIGVLTGTGEPLNLFPIMQKAATLRGIYVGSAEMFERMNRMLEFHRIAPVIDKTFAFSETQEAFSHMEGASHFGKIVIKVVV